MKIRSFVGLTLTFAGVVVSSLPTVADTHYVSPSGGHAPPFTNWSTAATNIQAAIDAASSNDTVLVTNGVYDTGGMVYIGPESNRIAITKPVTVRSVNGPSTTSIVGAGPIGNSAVRCAYVGEGARLEGFTLTNGHTRPHVLTPQEGKGAGAWCESTSVVSNCTIRGNHASYQGGGTYGGTIVRCMIIDNAAHGTRAVGGGAAHSKVRNSVIAGNSTEGLGGGCGGGVAEGEAENCTIIWNSATYGGGTCVTTVRNCIVQYNVATDEGDNCFTGSLFNIPIEFTCTTPLPAGAGNITNDPQFVDLATTNLHLKSTSPCIDTGTNLAWMAGTVDLDGLPRIINGMVDMGAYESPSPAITSITAPPEGPVITWTTFTGAQYAVYGSTNLVQGYDILLQDGIVADPPLNAFTATVSGAELRGYAVEYRP